jgi:acetone carboxylase gamma subunit
MKTWGNVIGIEEINNEKIWKCIKCNHNLGSTSKDWKTYAMKNVVPLSKAQPAELAFSTEKFKLREYYCPNCGVMFEVLNLDTVLPDPVTFNLTSK